jgi:hypothetical protein
MPSRHTHTYVPETRRYHLVMHVISGFTSHAVLTSFWQPSMAIPPCPSLIFALNFVASRTAARSNTGHGSEVRAARSVDSRLGSASGHPIANHGR